MFYKQQLDYKEPYRFSHYQSTLLHLWRLQDKKLVPECYVKQITQLITETIEVYIYILAQS